MSNEEMDESILRMMPSDCTPDELIFLLFRGKGTAIISRIKLAHRESRRSAWANLINRSLLRIIEVGELRSPSLFSKEASSWSASLQPPAGAAEQVRQFLADVEALVPFVFKLLDEHHLVHVFRTSISK